jgi:hypothetical protein
MQSSARVAEEHFKLDFSAKSAEKVQLVSRHSGLTEWNSAGTVPPIHPCRSAAYHIGEFNKMLGFPGKI